MTQYDMKVLDKIGLLKMDFLGLANLTMLAKALDNIKRVHGVELDLGQAAARRPEHVRHARPRRDAHRVPA